MNQNNEQRTERKMKTEKVTLAQIIERETARRTEGGSFGITACKKSIMFDVNFFKRDLYDLLKEYVQRANEDIFFNRAMVLACWELINEQ